MTMNPNLRKIISDVMLTKTDNNQDYTHFSYYGPREQYRLKMTEHTNFWERYCNLVDVEDDEDIDTIERISLAERISDTSPIIAAFNFKFSSSYGDEESFQDLSTPYSEEFLMSIVSCYQQAIIDNLALSNERYELICCVLEPRKNMVIDGVMTVSLKLQFPNCRSEIKVQKRAIRPAVIKYLRQMNVLRLLDEQPDNDWEVIIDPMVTTDPWPLYLATTGPDQSPMRLTQIYGFITQEHIDHVRSGTDDFSSSNEEEHAISDPHYALENVFSPTFHSHVGANLIRPELFERHDIEHWIPLFLSVNYWNTVAYGNRDIQFDENINVHNHRMIVPTPSSRVNNNDDDLSDMEIALKLIPHLSEERSTKEHFWMDVGKALSNSCKNGRDGLDAWIEFTNKTQTFKEEDCLRHYPSFIQDNSLTVKTIAWYAKHDNYTCYASWHNEWCEQAILQAVNTGTHSDVGVALYRLYWLEFVCTSIKLKTWYFFDNNKFNKLDQGHALRQKLRTGLIPRFEIFRTKLSMQIQESNDQSDKAIKELLMKKVTTLISRLKTVTFKNSLMIEAMDHFYCEFFDRYANKNPNLMGLINGVVETTEKYAIVRKGKPEDYVTMCAAVYWSEEFHDKHEKVQEFIYWMRQCFTDADLCHYFLMLLSSCLRSGNADKIFPVFTGEGNNSKSMVKKLIEAVFGPYSHTFPSSFFTQTRGKSNAASPELAMAMFAKIAWIQEPDESDSIMGGTLKEMTGLDQTYARLLHDNGGNFTVLFKLILMCNKIPTIPAADKAIKNRMAIVPFLSTWVNPNDPKNKIELPDDPAEQFKVGVFKLDADFSDRIPLMASAALWVLVTTYKDYRRYGLHPPEIITKTTEVYWEENDIYEQFKTESIVKAIRPGSVTDENPEGERDLDAKLTLSDVYTEFKFWFKNTYPGLKVPERPAVKYELEQRWGKLQRCGWSGIKLKENLANF